MNALLPLALLLGPAADISGGGPPPPPAVAGPTDAERYAEALRQVKRGQKVVLVVGAAGPPAEYTWLFAVPAGFNGIADGVYDCFLQDGEAKFRRRLAPPAPEVRVVPPFRPAAVTERGAADRDVPAGRPLTAAPPPLVSGTHGHTCGSCGTSWRHDDASHGDPLAHTCPRCGGGPWWTKTR